MKKILITYKKNNMEFFCDIDENGILFLKFNDRKKEYALHVKNLWDMTRQEEEGNTLEIFWINERINENLLLLDFYFKCLNEAEKMLKIGLDYFENRIKECGIYDYYIAALERRL